MLSLSVSICLSGAMQCMQSLLVSMVLLMSLKNAMFTSECVMGINNVENIFLSLLSLLPSGVRNHGLVKSAQWLFSYCWEGGKGTS
ncbi:hypothetical protein BKA57DRAFT_461764 [Linnemannia elongata]|nr:hypothetical protein BKA57DRAFT_461764 [Linnemannia elongata]